MLLSWIQPMTLLDYPGKVAAIIFTAGCNFRCPFCYNPDFVLPEKLKETMKDLIPEKAFFNFLEKRKEFLEGIVICWWEPTIQKDLYDFVKKIKSFWLLVKLDTNGQDPEILKKLIDENLVDYVAMDIKDSLENYELSWIKNLDMKPYLESIKILMEWKVDYEFRTTIIQWHHTKAKIEQIAKAIKWAKKYCLQNFEWKGKLLDPDFKGKRFTKKELEAMKEIVLRYVEICEIRT